CSGSPACRCCPGCRKSPSRPASSTAAQRGFHSLAGPAATRPCSTSLANWRTSAASSGHRGEAMTASIMYHDGNRRLQDQFDSRRISDRLEEKLTRTQFTADDKAFIESVPSFFLATADADGRPDCSHKGGMPGFVRVIGPSELAFPDYDGNG